MVRTFEGLLGKIRFTSGSEAEEGSRFEKLMVPHGQAHRRKPTAPCATWKAKAHCPFRDWLIAVETQTMPCPAVPRLRPVL